MSSMSWFWLTMLTVMTAGCIRELRLLFAMHRAFTASNTSTPREGQNAAENR
jgi:hypothetical protein